MDSKTINVHIVVDNSVFNYQISKETLAEDILIQCCQALKIGPVSRHLFALRFSNKNEFVSPGVRLFESQLVDFDLRLRYKLPQNKSLEKIDVHAYKYYFYQVRADVMDNKIPDISYDKNKDELVGLGVTDMYRVMLETGVTRESVENDYKKYIPKEVRKHHYFLVKKPIHNSLTSIIKGKTHKVDYVVNAYLKKFEDMAPNYLCEDYKAIIDELGTERSVILKVDPYHRDQPGVRYCYDGKTEFQHLCSIEELCYISVRPDSTAEISRKTGIPLYLRFYSVLSLSSFISLLDGYYRLSTKWTFNLCKDLQTPSLQKLYAMKCHGPVGGEFAYFKLEEKRNNKPGCFVLRESETAYDIYYIDICTSFSSKPTTYKIEKKGKEDYIFSANLVSYPSIIQLVISLRNPDSYINLQECLPPSEYDQSPLLLCKSEGFERSSNCVTREVLLGHPHCIDTRQLQVYRGRKKESQRKLTVVYRGVWKYQRNKKLDVALKVLKTEHRETRLPDFLELAGKWAFVESGAIVKLLGVTLMAPVSMVTEYFPLGSLNEYLRKNKGLLKEVDLVEAATCLATAVWHLEEAGIVHGNIRCRKLLVAAHSDISFTVRLADPGLPNQQYTSEDIPWIAVEWQSCGNMEGARRSHLADMWALGTTLWEIFSYGSSPMIISPNELLTFYSSGKRLPQPENCLKNIYDLMLSCWDADPHRRRRPQEAMRDINRILYQVFNSRRLHTYSTVNTQDINKRPATVAATAVAEDLSSIVSTSAGSPKRKSEVDWMGGGLVSSAGNISWGNENDWLLSDSRGTSTDMHSPDMSTIFSHLDLRTATTSLDSVTSLQDILELDGDYNVVLKGRIGQGFYGEVYIGSMEQFDNDGEVQQVAVKKLKSSTLASSLQQDFLREISIMQRLKHPNIVEIKGVIQEPEVSLVMEFVQHGSLQCYLKIHREDLNPFTNLLKFALDVAQGMEYLGEKNIVHRDLAARNILVANDMHVKISDFGLAQVMGSDNYYIIQTNRELPIKWYAPESLASGKFSTRSDVWSYGVTLFEMFSYGEDPRLNCANSGDSELDQNELLRALEQGARLPCPNECPQEIYVDLISPCWKYNSKERPMFTEISTRIVQIQEKHTNLIQLST